MPLMRSSRKSIRRAPAGLLVVIKSCPRRKGTLQGLRSSTRACRASRSQVEVAALHHGGPIARNLPYDTRQEILGHDALVRDGLACSNAKEPIALL